MAARWRTTSRRGRTRASWKSWTIPQRLAGRSAIDSDARQRAHPLGPGVSKRRPTGTSTSTCAMTSCFPARISTPTTGRSTARSARETRARAASRLWPTAAMRRRSTRTSRGRDHAVELLQFGVYRGIELDGLVPHPQYGLPLPVRRRRATIRRAARWRIAALTCTTPARADHARVARGPQPQGGASSRRGRCCCSRSTARSRARSMRKAGGGPHRVKARVRVRCEVTPITDVELIVNGQVVEHRSVPRAEGQGHWIELERDVTLAGVVVDRGAGVFAGADSAAGRRGAHQSGLRLPRQPRAVPARPRSMRGSRRSTARSPRHTAAAISPSGAGARLFPTVRATC